MINGLRYGTYMSMPSTPKIIKASRALVQPKQKYYNTNTLIRNNEVIHSRSVLGERVIPWHII